ncbi:dihydroorotate dehydrogenase [Selenomonas sp. TAMA-11512]|uniref:dihydroorotate dehydrogenase n=1 Tax=Selenomonas sp. TAMA-11512 TaxID=3095337 RepID=UPI00308715C3|nr:dihydroorotate dehydrogenase [Selenomonas sp. TAMA-11512]
MNARLETDISGISLKTPVLGASGTFGFGLEYRDFLDLDKVGGVVSKGITPTYRAGNPGNRIAETPSGMLNSIGLENPGMDAFIRDIVPQAVQMPTPFIVNFSAGSVEEFGEMAAKLEQTEVAGMEVNISCPNVKSEGIFFGTNPRLAADVTEAVKRATKKPVIVKLSPNVTDIKVIAKAVEEAGADAVSLINTLTGMAIDIRTRRPLLGNLTGGLSGPCIKPVALRMVYEVAQTVRIPVIGMGGIATAEDVVEFLLAGASAVQVGAENFRNPRAVVEIAETLDAYLEANGIASVKELVGALEV